jgi:AraC family transcriptional regulator
MTSGASLAWWNEEIGLQKLRTQHRDIVFSPANTRHSIDWTGSMVRMMLFLDNSVVERAAAELGMNGNLRFCPTANGRDDTIWHLAYTLFLEIDSDPLACPFYAESIANLLSVRLLRNFTDNKSAITLPALPLDAWQMARVDDYILSNLETYISVSQLAALVELGQLQFSRRLKAGTGMSPYQYVISKRVACACELLASTHQPIADIGFQVGFSAQSHFSSRFKQVVGTTPREYRLSKR